MAYALGIDLGGTNIKAVAVAPEGETLSQIEVQFDANVKMDWGKKIRGILAAITDRQGAAPTCIGLSAPGLAAADARSVACMPGRLEGLEGLNWTDYLASTRAVPVLNDAHAALLGEAWLGAAKGFRDVFMLTLGTGVGGAALVDGRLLRGHIGRGGHLGHICLDPNRPPGITRMPGSLEDAIGNSTLVQRSNGRFHATRELVDAHRAGDPEATRIWLESVRRLACGVGSLINVLDPEAVIIGGGIAKAGLALLEPVQRFLDEVEWRPTGTRVKLLPAELGELAGAYGAAHQALQQVC